MNLSQLPKIVGNSKRRVGRGHGSGRVKTSGRGTKGQNARDRMPPGFEGGQLSILKRLPLLRGKGKNMSHRRTVVAVRVERLNRLPAGTTVTVSELQKQGLLPAGERRVKIVGNGKLSKKLTVGVAVSAGARKAIEKAGGTVA